MFLKLVSNSSTYEQGNDDEYFPKSIYLKHQSNLSFLLSFHFFFCFLHNLFEFFQVVLISLLGSSFLFFFFNIIFLVVVWWLSWVWGLVFEEELSEPFSCSLSFFFLWFCFDLSWFWWVSIWRRTKSEPLGSLSFVLFWLLLLILWWGLVFEEELSEPLGHLLLFFFLYFILSLI